METLACWREKRWHGQSRLVGRTGLGPFWGLGRLASLSLRGRQVGGERDTALTILLAISGVKFAPCQGQCACGVIPKGPLSHTHALRLPPPPRSKDIFEE